MASKTEQIIDHFTDDTQLKIKILQAISANKGRRSGLAGILKGFNIEPGLQGRILDFIKKAGAGHDIDAVAGYYLNDRGAQEQLRNDVAYHRGAVKMILTN